MANPLPNEKELYQKIKDEKIVIAPAIWNMLYHRMGNDITAINLICQYYLISKESIPVADEKKLLTYTHHIKDIINQITCLSNEKFPFPEFKEDVPLHPVIRDMLTHYIGNDVYSINLIVGNSVLIDSQPLPLEHIQKILKHTQTIRNFMDRLREVTSII